MAATTYGDMLTSLLQEAREHPALNHVWLKNIAEQRYPNPTGALRDFAYQYHAYASAFPMYLKIVVDKLGDPNHKQALQHNLNEEGGQLDAIDTAILVDEGIDIEDIIGFSHPQLYHRFCTAMGISDSMLAEAAPVALAWRNELQDYLKSTSSAAAVGAVGIGTESIVKPMYEKLLRGMRSLDGLTRKDYVFFELHSIVDDQHALDLNRIASDLIAADVENLEQIRLGMNKALTLRLEFWDHLHKRATSQTRSQ
jgi:pyrroloquinoline quinone (PQQ) biosynthesis protein C